MNYSFISQWELITANIGGQMKQSFFFVFFIIMLRTEDEINILWRTNENVFFCITYHYVKNWRWKILYFPLSTRSLLLLLWNNNGARNNAYVQQVERFQKLVAGSRAAVDPFVSVADWLAWPGRPAASIHTCACRKRRHGARSFPVFSRWHWQEQGHRVIFFLQKSLYYALALANWWPWFTSEERPRPREGCVFTSGCCL